MARYSEIKTGLWEVIPQPTDPKARLTHQNKSARTDPLESLEKPYRKVCRFTGRPTTENRKEIHPDHIAKGGVCPYCGQLK